MNAPRDPFLALPDAAPAATPAAAPSARHGQADSITRRLRRGMAAALALASALTFGVLYAVGRSERVQAFEQALRDDWRTIANITQVYPDDDLYVNVEPESLPQFLAGGTRYFQVWDTASGELLDASPSLQALKLVLDRPGPATREPHRFDTQLGNGTPVSLVWQRTSAHWGLDEALQMRTGLVVRDREVELLVGRARSELDDALRPLALACLGAALLLPLVAVGLLNWLVPHALRPLRDLSQAVARRSADSGEPFPPSPVREMQPIVERLNELVARIEGQRRRERRFLDDTAHELRTPLAELHAIADVALLRPQDARRQAVALGDMKQITRRMAALVEMLFRLARHGRGAPLTLERVALAELVGVALADMREAVAERGLEWLCVGEGEAWIDTDPALVRALLDNLLGNVLAHARSGSVVQVRWAAQPRPMIEIHNDCADADPADAAGEHLGFGLDIARLVAQALGARLESAREGGRFQVRVEFGAA